MTRYFKLTEIGFDTSIEDEQSLVEIAHEHCSSYDDEREQLLPIDTVDKAIKYFTDYAFEVEELFAEEDKCPLCHSSNIHFGCAEVEFPTGVCLPCTCNECGATFKEWYDLTFSTQNHIQHEFGGKTIDELKGSED